jgi:hypothetical protein
MRLLQLVLFILVPIVNYVTYAIWPTPFDMGPETKINPAGYAFSIWGLIFLSMIIYSIFQYSGKRVENPHLRNATRAGILAALASIMFVPISYTQISWLVLLNVLWHLFALIWLFRALGKQYKLEKSPVTRWYYLPTQLYLGWICAATAVSVAITLKSFGMGYSPATEAILAAVVVAVITLLGILLTRKGGAVASAVLVWALVAVLVEHHQDAVLMWACISGITILTIAFIKRLFDKHPVIYSH